MTMKQVATIDAHHHLWRYQPDEFQWIDNSMKMPRRDYLPTDLVPAMIAANVDGRW